MLFWMFLIFSLLSRYEHSVDWSFSSSRSSYLARLLWSLPSSIFSRPRRGERKSMLSLLLSAAEESHLGPGVREAQTLRPPGRSSGLKIRLSWPTRTWTGIWFRIYEADWTARLPALSWAQMWGSQVLGWRPLASSCLATNPVDDVRRSDHAGLETLNIRIM